MNRKFLLSIIPCLLFPVILTMCTTTGRLNNTFYAQNTMGGFRDAPKTPREKAILVKSYGFDGLEGMGYKDFFELREALEKEGRKMPVNYVGLVFKADGKLENPASSDEIKAMIKASSRGDLIYFALISKDFKDSKTEGNKVAVKLLQEFADYAASYGVRLAVYPHAGFFCATVRHSVELARMVDRKNYGAVMNLCHLLKVEGSEGIEDKIKEAAPWLFAVNINGADDGDTRQMGWDRLIQPLGQGTFDTYRFVKLLKDNGYKGPIGVQFYNVSGNAAEILTQTVNTWKSYQKRYAEGK